MTESRYAYQSRQESILLPHYKRFVWEPALRWIPERVTPNALTLVAMLACGGSFVLGATASDRPLAMVAAAFLVFVYLSLDNMDGALARRAGRSSRLGEFLDHWLDTCNNGFVVLGACLAVGLPKGAVLGVLAITTLAFHAVQWELRQTGVFRMGRVADVEGNTAVSLLYLILAFVGPGWFASVPVAGLPSLAVLLGIGVSAQAAWTLFDAVHRVRDQRAALLPIVLAFAVLIAWAVPGGHTGGAHLAIGFFANPVFTSRPVLGRLLGRSTAAWDRLALVTLTAAFVATQADLARPGGGVLAWGVAFVFASITVRHGLSTILELRGRPARGAETAVERREAI